MISDEKNNAYDLIDRINMALENPNIEIDKKDREILSSNIDELIEFLTQKTTTTEYYEEILEKNKNMEELFINIFGEPEKDEHKKAEMNNKFYQQF